MTRTKTQTILRYGFYGIVAVAVAAFLLYFFVIRTVQIHNQKQNFAKAEASLDALEKQIESKVGKPDQIKKEKSCDRANLKSEQGPLGCAVRTSLLYENRTPANATSSMKNVSELSASQIRIGSGAASGSEFIDTDLQKGEQTFYQNFNLNVPLSCAFSYTFPAIDHEIFQSVSKENLQIIIDCGGPAKKEFFPIKN